MSDHDWAQLVQVGNAPSTETVEQCRRCAQVRFVYAYATLERRLTTARQYDHGELVPVQDECAPARASLPTLPDREVTAP